MKYQIVDLCDVKNIENKNWGDGLLFYSDEWKTRNKQISGFLSSKNGEGIKINARDCFIKEISKVDARNFIEENHIQGSNNLSLVFFGLFKDSDLLAVMSLGRHNRNISHNRIVLDRFCVEIGYIVRGGASKLLHSAVLWAKNKKYDELISFSDNRISDGNIYKILGFNLEKEHKSDYFYVNSSGQRLSKQSQMKSSCKCPEDLTEFEWAKQRGLSRFWDKGKKRWVLPLNDSFVSWTKKLSKKCAEQNKNGDFKQSHIRGYFKSDKNQKEIYYGSSYELRCMFLLESDGLVKSYERGDCFEDSKGKFRNPDLLVHFNDDSKCIFEIKPKSRLDETEVVEQIQESKKYAEKNSINFKLWTEDDSGFNSSEIINWAKKILANNGDTKWIELKKASSKKRSKKFYQTHIATDKVSVYCEFCKETHNPLRLTYDKNIARNNRYICEREGGHIAGSRSKDHLKKVNPYESEGKKKCNECENVLLKEEFGADKNKFDGLATRCKKCRRDKSNKKYREKIK